MALSDAQRQALLSSLPWTFPATGMRAALVGLGITDGKTHAQATAYAKANGGSFANKDDATRRRIASLVNTGVGGVLDALLQDGNHNKLTAAALSPHEFAVAKHLLQEDGYTLTAAISSAQGVGGSELQQEAVLYFLVCGEDLATAKVSAGL